MSIGNNDTAQSPSSAIRKSRFIDLTTTGVYMQMPAAVCRLHLTVSNFNPSFWPWSQLFLGNTAFLVFTAGSDGVSQFSLNLR